MYLMEKISRAGLILMVIGAVLLGASLGDTIVSFREARSFEDVLENGAAPGDHISGQVPFLLDAFANMQTWSEDSKTHATTAKKTSFQYYILPGGEGYLGLSVSSRNISRAEELVDQTYDYLMGGGAPSAELTADAHVAVMDRELAELFREAMKEYYGYTDEDLEAMGPILMVEPRAFGTIRIFCAVGAVVFLAGALMQVMRWRKVSARICRVQQETAGPELD